MASNQVKYGDQGTNAKILQTLLNRNGYKLTVDGIFGDETLNAVKDFQQKNGLTADGIAGVNTWTALQGDSYGKVTHTTPANNPNTKGAQGAPSVSTDAKPFENEDFNYKDFNYKDFTYGDFKYGDYQESDLVTEAKNALNAQLAQKPGEYRSQWQATLDDTINKILNREKFSYDLNGDAIYQQYKDKYIQQGKMAMGDAIGQASAMTGGYGNSWAQSVGQQQYQAQLENLNDIVPELYQMALDKYNQEGQDLYNQYAMIGDREDMDYGRYRDSVADWLTERDYLTGRYDAERDYDYGKYVDDRNFEYGKYADDRNFAYEKYSDDRNLAYEQYADNKDIAYSEYRNAIEDEYQKERDEKADEQWQAEYDAVYGDKDTGGNNNTGGNNYTYTGTDKGAYNNGSLSTEQVKALQEALGVTADGYFGEETMNAAGGLDANDAYDKFVGSQPTKESADDYADWDASDWNSYFAEIRHSEGKSAAEEELSRMIKEGLIPENMLSYASKGARGSLGH